MILTWWQMRREKNGPSIYDTMMDQSCITWYAGDRDEVPEAQKKVIRELGLKFRGKGQWQYFLSFEKGYTPFTLDAREARRHLRVCLWRCAQLRRNGYQ